MGRAHQLQPRRPTCKVTIQESGSDVRAKLGADSSRATRRAQEGTDSPVLGSDQRVRVLEGDQTADCGTNPPRYEFIHPSPPQSQGQSLGLRTRDPVRATGPHHRVPVRRARSATHDHDRRWPLGRRLLRSRRSVSRPTRAPRDHGRGRPDIRSPGQPGSPRPLRSRRRVRAGRRQGSRIRATRTSPSRACTTSRSGCSTPRRSRSDC